MTHSRDLIRRPRPFFLLVLGTIGLRGISVEAAGPEPAGWYAGDPHVHRSCGGSPVSVASIYSTMVSQDVAVISLLADMGNGEVQNPTTDLPLVNGKDASVSTTNRLVHWDAEWHWDADYTQYAHQALGGHIVALGLTNAYQIWSEYTYPIFDWAHRQGGIGGFAHFQYLDDNFPTSLTCCTPIEYPVEVALGSCDFVSEDVNGSDYFIHAYYRLLNCGFRPGFAAGSDYPCASVIGPLLTYSQVAGGKLTYSNWIHAIASGRTIVSRNYRNEFVNLVVNGTATPGDEVRLSSAGSVPVTVTWTAQTSLTGTVELVCNGVVVASQQATAGPGSPVTLSTAVNFPASGWLCARRMNSSGHQAHTAAVFVTVNNAPVRASVADAQFYVQWMQNLLQNTSAGGIWNSFFPTSLAAVQARYQAALSVYQQILQDALGAQSVAVATTSLPYGIVNGAYSATLAATGGTSPYSWSILSGSLPAGLTLNSTNGIISGTPTAAGVSSFTVQVSDSSSATQSASAAFNLVVSLGPLATIWPNTAAPSVSDGGADSAVELGVKFRSDVGGSITGIRFYKDVANIGTHAGNLWSSGGVLLASVTFSNETASGWQQMFFPTPVTMASNTVYVASYHANNGHYSADANFFTAKGVDNTPLHALTNGVSGGNGVYAYGVSSIFPNQTWNAANYWVDVLIRSVAIRTLASIAVTPANVTNLVGTTQQFTATGTYSDNSTQDLTSQATWTSTSPSVASINSNGLATSLAAGGTTLSATVGTVAGGALLTVKVAPLNQVTTLWPNTAVPGAVDTGADSPVELGVKFRSDVAGNIAGLRFYKAAANTGTHVGNLWSSTGALLTSVTYSNETASGWQQAALATPVAITSNTVYVASYHSVKGHYSADVNYFASQGVDSPPLHALTNKTTNANGVYVYCATSTFPNQAFRAANYWVDVVFQVPLAPILASIAVAPACSTNAVGTSQQFAATGMYSDGSTNDLSTQVTWASSNSAVATINTNGLDMATSPGTTLITAALSGVSGTASLIVFDPVTPPQLMSLSLAGGVFQFGFTNAPGAAFTVWNTTNLMLPMSQWSNLGAPAEMAPGQYQFSDPQATNYPQQFYMLRHP